MWSEDLDYPAERVARIKLWVLVEFFVWLLTEERQGDSQRSRVLQQRKREMDTRKPKETTDAFCPLRTSQTGDIRPT